MKIVIDISKDRYDEIMSMDWKNGRRFFDEEIRAIHDGKALEQEPKMGYWIEHIHNGMHYIECPKCSSWFLRMFLTQNSYCPNCGCKMQEVENDG